MAFSANDSGSGAPKADINVVPLVDVLLVLLIIFMVTAPLMSHKIEVELPEANLDQTDETKDKVQPITLAITEEGRSEEHTSELQSLMRISYAVFCLKKKKPDTTTKHERLKPHKQIT